MKFLLEYRFFGENKTQVWHNDRQGAIDAAVTMDALIEYTDVALYELVSINFREEA